MRVISFFIGFLYAEPAFVYLPIVDASMPVIRENDIDIFCDSQIYSGSNSGIASYPTG